MRIECENCSAAFTIADALLGDQPVGAQCPYCGHVEVIGGAPMDAVGPPGSGIGPPPDAFGPPPPGDLFGPGPGEPMAPPSFGSFPPGGGASSAEDRFGAAASSLEASSDGLCQVCGTPLLDEFDKVIGLCETHQRDRANAVDVAAAAAPDEWIVALPDGQTRGPMTLAELKIRVERGEIPVGSDASRDGFSFAPIAAFPELAGLSTVASHLSAGPASPPPAELRSPLLAPSGLPGVGPRTFIAPARRRASLGPGAWIAILLFVALAAGGSWAVANPEVARAWVARLTNPPPPKLPSRANPLAAELERWRGVHRDVSGTPDEHVRAALARQKPDADPDYAAADVDIQKAMLLDDDDPRLVALYVENLARWQEGSFDEASAARLRPALAYADARIEDLEAAGRTEKLFAAKVSVARARSALELAAGNLNDGREWAERARKIEPEDPVARLYLARSYAEGNTSLAISDAEAVKSRHPELRAVDRVLARAYANDGRYGTAIRLLEARLHDDEANVAVRLLVGRLRHELGDVEGARAEYLRAAKGQGDQVAARLEATLVDIERGDPTAALRLLRPLVAEKDLPRRHHRRALVALARAELERGRAKDAASPLEDALKIDGDAPDALLARADYELAIGSPKAAQGYAERARKGLPNEPAVLVALGRSLARQKNADDAHRAFESAIANDLFDPRLKGILAAMYLSFGSSAQAFGAMRQVADLDPASNASRHMKGLLAIGDGAIGEAIERFAAAATDPRNRSLALSSIGVMEYQRGRVEPARQAIAAALGADEANIIARLYEAQLALDAGKAPQSEEAARTVLDIDRASAMGHLMLARALAARGRHRDAKESYDAALRSAPGLVIAKVELAGLGLARGSPAGRGEILETLKHAHRLHPHVRATRRLLFEAGY